MSHTTRSGGKHSTASGLVKKIETSPLKHKKRVQRLKRKMSAFVKEHRRMSKIYGLYAVAITLTYPVWFSAFWQACFIVYRQASSKAQANEQAAFVCLDARVRHGVSLSPDDLAASRYAA